jgi:hypothetical protein
VARPDALEDCVERLAKKAAALPHERRMALVWINHAALPEARADRWRAAFAARLEAAQVKWVQGEAAPALRVAIESTPSEIVFTASVPAEGTTNVVIEDVARAQIGLDESSGSRVRLEKQLVWLQEGRILSAALLPITGTSEKRLVVLAEETLTVLRGDGGNWERASARALPGPRQTMRSARGQLLATEERADQVAVLLPGRRCEANLADESTPACASVSVEWPTGKLLAMPSCGTQTWWLKSDSGDFASQDRLILQNSGAGKDAATIAELTVAGPVISIAAGENAGAAVAVVRNLTSGNYEVYRIAVVCGD